MLLAMVLLPLLMLTIHAFLAYLIKRNTAFPSSLAWLLALTLLVTCIWFLVTLPIAYFTAMCCLEQEDPFERALYARTLGLPFSLCSVFPQLPDVLGTWICDFATYLSLPVSLFSLGLLVFAFTRRRVRE